MDPTKLKSRTFQQAAKPTAAKASSSGVNLWTETPAERQQRMEDEMMGKKRKAEISGSGDDEEDTDERRRKRERDWKLREEVERHNVRPSLSRFPPIKSNLTVFRRRINRKQQDHQHFSTHMPNPRNRKRMKRTKKDHQEFGTVIVTCLLVVGSWTTQREEISFKARRTWVGSLVQVLTFDLLSLTPMVICIA